MSKNLRRADHVMISHLQATWSRALKANVDCRIAVEREKRVFELMRQFDPTDGKYHSWIAAWRRRHWSTYGFGAPIDVAQLDDVRRALSRFESIREQLPETARDVGLYRTVEDLNSTVPSHIAENRKRRESDALKKQAYAESAFLFREDRWMVVRLLGYNAARFWGLGTRWCTTRSEHTYFSYAAGGEMRVYLTPAGRFQYASRSGTFRDERDGPVRMDIFRPAPEGFRRLLPGRDTS